MGEHTTEKVTLDDLCKHSDIITLHAPKTSETVSLLDKKAFALMKKGVVLINAARSEIIDKNAMLEGLNNGTISRVALDVFINEPYDIEWDVVKHDSVIPTPHIGGSTDEALRRISMSTAESIIRFILHADTSNVINKKKL